MMGIVKHSQRTIRKPCRYCGSKALYWAHDTDASGKGCNECNLPGVSWMLLDAETLEPHALKCSRSAGSDPDDNAPVPFGFSGSGATVKAEPEVKAKPSPVKREAAPAPDVDAGIAALRALIGAQPVDRDEVEAIVKQAIADVVFPTRTVVVKDGVKREIGGRTHRKVADVLVDLSAGEHVMMVGPAGTGKTTIAEQCAEALGIPFYAQSCGPTMPTSQIVGYMEASGKYVRSLFREAYENGGVFLFDEIDNSHPGLLAVINAALANGMMGFPDGMVKRHDDFRCVAAANTYGKGADRQYVGRQQLDAATLDRFAIETIEIDEALERDLCLATGLNEEQVTAVLELVRKLRANAEAKKMLVVLSPRASIGMCKLLVAGRKWSDAVSIRVKRGMSAQDWSKLNG